MAAVVKCAAAGSTAVTFVMAFLYQKTGGALLLTLAITFGTTAYHFNMRLLVGGIVNSFLHNQIDYQKKWFRPRPFEEKLYEICRVKQWKKKLPTYAPSLFSLKTCTPEMIAQAMCQAEIVHEIIVVLSFLPLLGAGWFGAFPVFLLTSLCAAGFDLLFVIVQRYNRPRILHLEERKRWSFS